MVTIIRIIIATFIETLKYFMSFVNLYNLNTMEIEKPIGCLTFEEAKELGYELSNNYSQLDEDTGMLMPCCLSALSDDVLLSFPMDDITIEFLRKSGYFRMKAMMRSKVYPLVFEYDSDYGFVEVFIPCVIVLDSVKSVAESLAEVRSFVADVNAEIVGEDYRFVEKEMIINHQVYPYLYKLMVELEDEFYSEHVLLRRLLQVCNDVESNPGPSTSVLFSNYATIHHEFYDLNIHENATVDATSVTWKVKIETNCDKSLSSGYNEHRNKKQAYEMCYQQILSKIPFRKEIIVPESERPTESAHGEESAEVDTALHTNLAVTTDPSVGIPTSVGGSFLTKTTTEAIGDYSNLTEQWYLIDDFEWDATDTGMLREYVLPRDVLTANVPANSPPLIPFNVNYMWSGDLELRIETKAQMFLTGSLQVASYYELNADINAGLRRNIYTASQTNHVLINAGGSNEAILRIPYVNRQPFIQTKLDNLNVATASVLNMVNVLIQVLNPLRVGTGSASVSVAVFIRFIDAKFHGKRDGAIGTIPASLSQIKGDGPTRGQRMIGYDYVVPEASLLVDLGVALAEKAVNQFKKNRNRDNPPAVAPSQILVPLPAQSWAHGKDIAEPLRPLRLDPTGQTLHDLQLESIDTVEEICKIFGLLRQVVWSESDLPGQTLFKFPCTPLADFGEYVNDGGLLSYGYYIPPVGVVASMFNLYRGPLKFRLDVIANKFYTGGLILGYIPGIDIDTPITNNMIRNSAFTTYSLDANNLSITYETPYINAAEWYTTIFRKPLSLTNRRLPGVFVVNVLQRLQQPSNVSSAVDINFYMAGGDNFECANLTQPALVLRQDAFPVVDPLLAFIPVTLFANIGWNDFGSPYFDDGNRRALSVTAVPSSVARLWTTVQPELAFICQMNVAVTGVPAITTNLCCMLKVGSTFVCALFDSTPPNLADLMLLLNTYEDTEAYRTTLAPYLYTGVVLPITPLPQIWIIWRPEDPILAVNDCMKMEDLHVYEDVIVPESERDANPNFSTSVQAFGSNGWGTSCFGESFTNVYDLLRRPTHNESFTFSDSITSRYPFALFKLKVTPVPPGPNYSDNFDILNRSSHARILLSGYRYYRGGMRYRIIFPYLPGVFVWAQYDASDKIAPTSILYPDLLLPTPILRHSNPLDILTLSVNQIMNIEIPWYNANDLNYLQDTNFAAIDEDQAIAADMGSIMVGFSTNTNVSIAGDYTVNVYSKIADDFSLSVFQGFTSMQYLTVLNDTTIPEVIVPESDRDEGYVSGVVRKRVIQPVVDQIKEEIEGVCDGVGKAVEKILQQVKASSIVNMDFNLNSVLTDIMSQLGHCLINPSVKTLGWSVISMLAKIGILSYNMIAKASKLFSDICQIVFNPARVTNPVQDLGEAVIESDNVFVDEPGLSAHLAAFWGLIISACAALVQVKSYPSLNIFDMGKNLLPIIRTFTMTANSLTNFFKLHLDMLSEIFKHLCFWKSVHEKVPHSLEIYNGTFVKAWCEEVSLLTAPGHDQVIMTDTYLMDRVYLAFLIGQLISKSIVDKSNEKNNAILLNYLNRIGKLHEDCVATGKTGCVRMETFGVWIHGNPGIGKSYMVESLTTELLLAADISFSGEKTLPLNPADKYWSRCMKQPVVFMDDAFALTTDESKQSQLAAIFAIMTPAPLCPVMADIKHKDRLYSPDIFVACSNLLFPIIDGVTDRVALWRRRNLLVDVKINENVPNWHPAIKTADLKAMNIPGLNLEKYEHLLFRIAQDPSDLRTRWTQFMDWEQFVVTSRRMFLEFRTQATVSYNFRLNEFYRAQKKVMPNYENLLANIPDGENLYVIAAALAERLGSSLLKKSDSAWYGPMKETCLKNVNYLSNLFKDTYLGVEKRMFDFNWTNILQNVEITVPQADVDVDLEDPDDIIRVLKREIRLVSYWSKTLKSIVVYVTGLRGYIGEPGFLKVLKIIYDRMEQRKDFVGHSIMSDKTRFERLFDAVVNCLREMVNCKHFPLFGFGYTYRSSSFAYEYENGDEESIPGICCHMEKCVLTCGGLVDHLFSYTMVEDEPPPYLNGDLFLEWDERYDEPKPEENENYYWTLIKKYCTIAWNVFKEWWPYITAGVGVFAFAYAMMRRGSGKEVVAEGAKYDANKLSKQSRQILKKASLKIVKMQNRAHKEMTEVNPESSANIDDVVNKVKNNTIFLRVKFNEDGKDKHKDYRCVMIGDRKCLMIRHYIEEIHYYVNHFKNACVVMLCNNGEREVDIPRGAFDEISVLDGYKADVPDLTSQVGYKIFNSMCVVEFPKICPQFKNLIKHFVTSNEEMRLDSAACLVMIDPNLTVNRHYVEAKTKTKTTIITQTDITSQIEIDRCWEYAQVHGYGYCGSILVHMRTAKIIGMHTAGGLYSHNGYSERLIREEFDGVEQSMSMEIFIPNLEPIELTDRVLEGSVFPIGKVPRDYAKGESGRTRIVPSLIHGEEFEVRTEPAPLSPYDERLPPGSSPLYDGIAKHGNPSKEFPQWAVDLAVEDFGNLLISKCKPLRPVGILSEKEAIFGNPDYNFHSIPMDSSEGFPLSKLRPKGLKGKGWLFNINRDPVSNDVIDYKLHRELRKQMDVKWAMREKNIKPFTVFQDCTKDETLPKKKCRIKGKTRIFSMSPIDFTIHCRQVFGDFIMAHTYHASKLEHAIGIDPLNTETWTELHNYVTSVGDDVIAGDFSNFGPQAVSQIAHALYSKIEAWYKHNGATEEHLRFIRIMGEELINSTHLCFVFLYAVFCGIVSGSFITANFNSKVHSVYMRIAWLLITLENNFINYYKHFKLITYGDDGLGGISRLYREVFNVATLRSFFAEYGINYTSVDKDDNVIPYCKIEETSFLKHKWIPHPRKHGYYLAALDTESIEGQMNWVRDEGDLRDNTIRNCENALRQAYGHGPDYYSELYARIRKVLSTKGEHFVAQTWDELFIEHEKRVNTC